LKEKIHPTFYTDAVVTCASCGTTWTTGSTRKSLHVEVCSNCHPFYSGEGARLLDVEGQVDRFYRKVQAAKDYTAQKQAREEAKNPMNHPISELELGTRPTDALTKAGLDTVGKLLERLSEGDDAVLAISGFGRKSLIDTKRRLRTMGFEIPEPAAG
jgi:large subunit ribosomal protein L31